MIKLNFSDRCKYIAKDKSGSTFLYGSTPRLENIQWMGECIESSSIHLPMPWDKSLHKLIRDKDGFVVDLEPCIPDPREELKVDDKVWVWNFDGRPKRPRYFSSYDKDNRGISTFIDGATSFSTDGDLVHWECWEKA